MLDAAYLNTRFGGLPKYSFIIATRNDMYNASAANTPVFRLKTAMQHNVDALEAASIDYEFVIADVRSDDRGLDSFAEWPKVHVQVVSQQQTKKYATPFYETKALNHAAKKCAGEWICRLDNDTFLGFDFARWLAGDELKLVTGRRDRVGSRLCPSDQAFNYPHLR
jgi:cellulose synthase/poly-beta-1,6-N-acetylglucosamine synthase-like glycosyltransferase